MNKLRFTAERIKKLEHTKTNQRQTFYWDDVTPGLGLRVTSSGKAFIFKASLNNKGLRVTIGNTKTWTIGNARKEATKLKQLVDQGKDPRKIKAEQIAKEEAAREAERIEQERYKLTVQEAWDTYIEYHSQHNNPKIKWSTRHHTDHTNLSQKGGEARKRGKGKTVQGVLYPILQYKLHEITEQLLIDWVRKEAKTRANNARQGYELFRAFWRWCSKEPKYSPIIDANIIETDKLKAEVPSRKTKERDTLEKSQLKAWFNAVRSLNNPVLSAYLQGLLITGARRNELAELRWDDVNFTWNSIWLKDKVDQENGRTIPLTPYFASIIITLPRRSEWVFSSPTSASGHIVEPRVPHNRALSTTDIGHISLHGLRRSFSTLSEWLELPVGIVAQIQGHKPSATAEKHYKRRPLELLALHHGKYESWLLEQAGIEFSSTGNIQPKLQAVN